MSTKTGAHLYEILRSATNGGSNAMRAPSPQPIPRPTASAPAPLEDAGGSTATSTLTPPPVPVPPNVEAIVRAPDTAKDPTPLPRLRVEPTKPRIMLTPQLPGSTVHPAPARLDINRPPAAPQTPGERVLKLTYNNAAFAALIGVAVLFGAYSIGMRVGRTQTPASPAAGAPIPSGEADPAAAQPAPINPKLFSIKLMEWPAQNQQQLTVAKANAQASKNSLATAGYRDAQILTTTDRVVLVYGTFENRSSDQAKATLEALKRIKLERDREPRFAKAGFVEVTR